MCCLIDGIVSIRQHFMVVLYQKYNHFMFSLIIVMSPCYNHLKFFFWFPGNTLNCNHPVAMELILDSLRHWYGPKFMNIREIYWMNGFDE